MCRGDKVELIWNTLDRGDVVLTGVLTDGDGYGYCVKLDVPTPFALGREPREGLWCNGVSARITRNLSR